MKSKSKCELCGKRKYLFSVTKDEQEVQACSVCITDQLLTGWSK
jgi:ribosome-binding protein aMBF1 (putative translation factor)